MRKSVAVLAASLVVAACGGGSGLTVTTTTEAATTISLPAPDDQAVIDLLVDRFMEDAEESNPLGDDDEVECFFEVLVPELGLTRLGELGVTAERAPLPEVMFARLDPAEMDRAVEIARFCEDVVERMHDAVTGEGVSDMSADCFVGVLDDDGFFDRMVRDLSLLRMTLEEAGVMTELEAAADECLTAEEREWLFEGGDGDVAETVPPDDDDDGTDTTMGG